MPYYQNVFNSDFVGSLLLGDRQLSLNFKVKGNTNSSTNLIAWNQEPYNLTGNTQLTFNYSFNSGNTWTAYTHNFSGDTAYIGSIGAARAFELAAALSADPTFSALYSASVANDARSNTNWLRVNSVASRESWKCYISNTGAERIIRFNKKCGVAELPTFMARHTISNEVTYPDSVALLIQLDTTNTNGIDQRIVKDAGFSNQVSMSGATATIGNTLPFAVGDNVVVFDGTNTLNTTISAITTNTSLTLTSAAWTGATIAQIVVIHADYQLLKGKSGIFTFQNITVNAEDQITQVIEYSAGAIVGDFAKLIKYVYANTTQTNPIKITEQPYVLSINDLITP